MMKTAFMFLGLVSPAVLAPSRAMSTPPSSAGAGSMVPAGPEALSVLCNQEPHLDTQSIELPLCCVLVQNLPAGQLGQYSGCPN